MPRFYFTYGTKGFPFVGGWTVVTAQDGHAAREAFKAIHPNKVTGILNCADVYCEEEFLLSGMPVRGNRGAYCHESITLKCEVYTK